LKPGVECLACARIIRGTFKAFKIRKKNLREYAKNNKDGDRKKEEKRYFCQICLEADRSRDCTNEIKKQSQSRKANHHTRRQ